MKINEINRTVVLGHRGACGYAPENTMEAFALAIEMQADGIELDVQLTKDGEIVVCHDETIDRTSDGKGFIKDYTLDQLKQFNFNLTFEQYGTCRIPTLREVFELYAPTDKMINIELKTGILDYPGIEEKVTGMVREFGMEDRIIYSSFNHNSVMKVKKLVDDAYIAFLFNDKIIDQAAYTKKYGCNAIHPPVYFLLDPSFMVDCKKEGLEVNVWYCDDPKIMKQAIIQGVRTIITNYPDIALQIAKGE